MHFILRVQNIPNRLTVSKAVLLFIVSWDNRIVPTMVSIAMNIMLHQHRYHYTMLNI